MSPFALPLPVVSSVLTWAHKPESQFPRFHPSPWPCPSDPTDSALYTLHSFYCFPPRAAEAVKADCTHCPSIWPASPNSPYLFARLTPKLHQVSPVLSHPPWVSLCCITQDCISLSQKLSCTTWGQECHLMYLCPPCLMHYTTWC